VEAVAKYFLFSGAVILLWAGFPLFPLLLYGVPEPVTAEGILFFAAARAGEASAFFLLGALGLLYRPNRFTGLSLGHLLRLVW
jgi:hypothetical protein